jgi:hypothetical protein
MAAVRKDTGLHYLKHAAARLGMTLDQFLDSARVQRCSACRTAYCDPWLDPETASYVFTAAAPDHIAGWANFEHWLSSDRPNDVQAANRRLYEALERRIGAISSYAEFGCPFQGFLLQFKAQEEAVPWRLARFSRAMNRGTDPRWTKGARAHHAAARLANALVMAYHRLRALKERGARPRAAPVPGTRLLLTQDTTRAWGGSCVRYGGSCRYFAREVLDADVLPFEDEARGGRAPLDLLGIFNGLDHTSDPLRVLRGGLALARHIVVSTHHASQAGKQHQYAFDEEFPRWLGGTLEGAAVEDLTPEVIGAGRRNNNYSLISRRGR